MLECPESLDLSALEVAPFIFKREFSHQMTLPGREISKSWRKVFFYVFQDWGGGGGFKDIFEEEKKIELILNALLDFVVRNTIYDTF